MDVQQLCTVLRATLSSDTKEISAAETVLKQHETVKGQVVNLLRVAVEDSLDPGMRQVAAIAFKRVVERQWEPKKEGEPSPLNAEDKAEVRNNLIEAVVRSPALVRKQLVMVLRSVVCSDFPAEWPGLKDTIVQNLFSNDEQQVYGAMVALRWVARKFEFREQENRGAMDEILAVTFPKVLEYFRSLAVNPTPSPFCAELQKIVCKIVWALTFTTVPPVLNVPDNFNSLMETLLILLKKEVPLDQMPATREEQEGWCWWKAKKWVLHLTTRFFRCFGVVETVKEDNRGFATMYASQCMIPLLEGHLQCLAATMQYPHPNRRVLTKLLQYMTHAVSHAEAYEKVLKNLAKPMLLNVVFPLMWFNDEDAEMFSNDPQEFVRKEYNILEDIYNVKPAAMNFTFELCSCHSKDVLADYLNHLVQAMNQHSLALQAGEVPADIARKMDGALLGVEAVADVLKKKKAYKHEMEGLMLQYVVPCFSSAHGHLRARACSLVSRFADLSFKEGRGRGQTFGLLLHNVVACMKDAELPVRVDAVVALRHFIEAVYNLNDLKPILPDLLEQFFKLMSEVDNEDMVFTLESIIDKFGDEIAPYAESLAHNLTLAFFKCVKSEEEDDDEEDLGALAAFGCLRAINTLLESVSNMPALFPKLEEICFPIMDKMTDQDAQDVFEDVMTMVSYFTYFGPEVSPRMWSLWPKMHAALLEWAIFFFEEMLDPMENFIIKGKEVFLGCKAPDYLSSLNQMIEHVMTADYKETEIMPAPRLMEIVLQHCKGRVDACVGPYLILSLKKMQEVERTHSRVMFLNVVANALIYNAGLTLQVLQREGATQMVFSKWFELIFSQKQGEKWKTFRRLQDKKVSILGLCSLISVPDAMLPPELANGMGQILGAIVKLLLATKQQEELLGASSERGMKSDSDVGEDDDDDEDDDEDEDDDDREALNAEYIRRLHKEAQATLGLYDTDDSSDDDDSIDEDIDSPLAHLDPFVAFADLMGELEKANPARLQMLMGSVDAGAQQQVRAMMEYAASQRNRLAQANGQTNGISNGHG